MKRRALLLAGGAWLAVASGIALSQAAKLRRIAVLFPGNEEAYRARFDIFRMDLNKLGHVEGRDVQFDMRLADDRVERLPSMAAALVALKPSVILTGTSAGVAACKQATSTIPIVFATAASPVEQGFVASLRQPGGNITGVLVYIDVVSKLIEVAREAMPKARKLGIPAYEPDPVHKLVIDLFMPAAKKFNFEPIVVRVKRPEDLSLALKEVSRQKIDALYLPDMSFVRSHTATIVENSLVAKFPLLTGYEDITAAGGLLSYGPNRDENWRRAAVLVDKILRGAKPGELPVEQPKELQLMVNLKTAKAMGIALSPTTLARAEKVFE